MKIVPKPEGFELRDKRSSKARDSALWSPQDAMHDASKDMATRKVDSVLIVYREDHGDDTFTTHYRCSGNEGLAHKLALTALGKIMGWTQ